MWYDTVDKPIRPGELRRGKEGNEARKTLFHVERPADGADPAGGLVRAADEEGADDPSSSYLYGGIACLKDHYYFFSEAEDSVLFEKPVSGGASVGLGTISSQQLMGDDGSGYHVSSCFLIVWRD